MDDAELIARARAGEIRSMGKRFDVTAVPVCFRLDDSSDEFFAGEVGGRSIELEQIGLSLCHALEEHFGEGQVPAHLESQASLVRDFLGAAEVHVRRFIANVHRADGGAGFLERD